MRKKILFPPLLAFLCLFFISSGLQAQAALETGSTTGTEKEVIPPSSTTHQDYRPAKGIALTSKIVNENSVEFTFEIMGMNQEFIKAIQPSEKDDPAEISAIFAQNFSILKVDEKNHLLMVKSNDREMNEAEILSFLQKTQEESGRVIDKPDTH